MFRKILVPLDGSALAEIALQTAVSLAQQAQGKIILLQIPTIHTPVLPSTPEAVTFNLYAPEYAVDEGVGTSREYLNQIRYGFGRHIEDVQWQVCVEEGDPASVIVDVAQEENVDLIAMSTHGRSGLGRWVMGSVTEKVLRHAPCPVLTVRSTRPLNKILVTLDGSELAERSIPYALDLAEVLETEVTLLQVQTGVSLVDLEAAATLDAYEHGMGQRYMDGEYEREIIYLENRWHDCQRNGIKIKTAVREGKPAQTILEYARHNQIDLIAMTTHGRTGLRRWRYGSVTEKVLRGTDCAMLIVRSPEEELK